MNKFPHISILGLACLAACSVPPDTSTMMHEDPTVHRARTVMVGMDEAQLRMCAGFPTYGVKISEAEKIWTYQRNYARGSLHVGVTSLALGPVPGVTGATGIGVEGFCNTQVRLVKGRVVQVEFAGDNNTATRINGLCVSTVDGCVAYAGRLHGFTAPAK